VYEPKYANKPQMNKPIKESTIKLFN